MSAALSTEGASAATLPLWRLLQSTASALQAVAAGQSGSAVLAAVPGGQRAAVQALLFQSLRHWGRAQVLRQLLAPRRPIPAVDALLCCALALAWDEALAPYTPFTLVNQAVEAAKRQPALRAQAGFINACLRRFLRERDALVAASQQHALAQFNHPQWWVDRLRQDHPAQWQQILAANNQQPPMVLRVSESKVTVAQYQQALTAINIDAKPVGFSGLVLARPVPVTQLPGFAQGWVSVQDAAAQMAAPLLLQGLDQRQPLRLLDACAAPGGKTAHLLDWARVRQAPWQVTALEVDGQRAQRIHENLQRLDVQAQVVVADAGQPQTWWPSACASQWFDAILLDAPCTASGIVRRHPDVRWLRRASDVAQLAAQQARLLAALWPLLRPGGRLLYCTCSVFLAEGQEQVQAFVARNTDAQLLPSPGHLLPSYGAGGTDLPDNARGEHDGFFYALLHKLPASA